MKKTISNMYEDYLTMPCAIGFEEACYCFTEICNAIDSADEVLQEIYQDFINACSRYAVIRAEWSCLSKEEKLEKDPSRTGAHNRVIDAYNILLRYMVNQGLSTKWDETIAYEINNKLTRKRLGDFACYVTLFLGLHSR